MTERHFREGAQQDAEWIVALINQAFEPEERFLYDGPRIEMEEVLQKLAQGRFLLEIGSHGTIRGCVYVEITGADVGYLGLLAVSPAHQGVGIGQALIVEAESFFRTRGCRIVEIWAVNHRPALISFYLGKGYEVTGKRPFEYEKLRLPSHFVVLHKGL